MTPTKTNRGRKITRKPALAPKAVSARFDKGQGKIVIELSTGLTISFRPGDAQGLENATETDLKEIVISPSGFGLHFPRIDADLSIPALLEGYFGSSPWMARRG